MRALSFAPLAALLALFALFALPVRADVASWDRERIVALSAELAGEAGALYDAVFRQPLPVGVPNERRDYFRLKREVRHLRNEARHYARAVQGGEGQEETAASFEALLSSARWSEQRARRVFTVREVQQHAEAVRRILAELSRYYEDPGPLPEPYAR